jgi:DNA-binding LacI/PurR family transcriptional regulator
MVTAFEAMLWGPERDGGGCRDEMPRVVTVHVPYEEIGRAGAGLAVDVTLDVRGARKLVVMSTHVVVRQSVAPLAG